MFPLWSRILRQAESLIVCFLLWLAMAAVHAEGIQVKSSAIELEEESYYLNAEFEVNLNTTLEEALKRGVSLYFVTELEIVQPKWYWFDETAVDMELDHRLSYNALTRQYRLSTGALYQNFDTLNEAVQVFSRIRNRLIADKATLKNNVSYIASLRMRLDVSRLPKPFQVNAIASKDWHLSSDWHRWNLTP